MLQFYYLYYIISNMFRFIASHPQGDRAVGESRLLYGGFLKTAIKLTKKSQNLSKHKHNVI